MAYLDTTGLARLWQHILTRMSQKVDKVDGKTLSTNDYTNEDKEKLASIGPFVATSSSRIISDAIAGNALSVVTKIQPRLENGEMAPSYDGGLFMDGATSLSLTINDVGYTRSFPSGVLIGSYDWTAGQLTADSI